jgi:hypothetical protein
MGKFQKALPNQVEFADEGRIVIMYLTCGQVTVLDFSSWIQPKIREHRWCGAWNPYTKTYYCYRKISNPGGRQSDQRLHRLVFSLESDIAGLYVDHSSGDTLDNRVSNLRSATPSQNQFNKRKQATHNGKPTTSLHKGVSLDKRLNLWYARIRTNGKTKHLGYFESELDAAKAYEEAASLCFGEFAVGARKGIASTCRF